MYSILGTTYNSILRLDTESNSLFYLMQEELILPNDIKEVMQKLRVTTVSSLIQGSLPLGQFRQFVSIDQTTDDQASLSIINNQGIDDIHTQAEKLKLIVYSYINHHGQPDQSLFLIRNNMSFQEFYSFIREKSYVIQSKLDLVKLLNHIKAKVDIIPSYLYWDSTTDKFSMTQNTEDIGFRSSVLTKKFNRLK